MDTFILAVVEEEEVQISSPYYRSPTSVLYIDIIVENKLRFSLPLKQVSAMLKSFWKEAKIDGS